jgi:hypothetical protein
LRALFKQRFADEKNGRAVWKRTPYFGGGSVNDAREFRKQLAEAFGKEAKGEAAVEATLWLLDEERIAENQKAGVLTLQRLEGPKATAALKQILAQPHPNGVVLTTALNEAGKRKLKELGPNVSALCNHYRKTVRDQARKTAQTLNLGQIPEYDPEKAFTPWLEKQLRNVAAMVLTPIPADAKWVELTTEGKDGQTVTGWLIADKDDHYRLTNWFGTDVELPKKGTTLKQISLADTVAEFHDLRTDKNDRPRERLSQRGGLTGQFQPGFISQPELVVGAWAFVRGDRKSASAVLFERIDQMADDRWLTDVARDLIGHAYHLEMLNVYSDQRDYPRVLALARHIAKPVLMATSTKSAPRTWPGNSPGERRTSRPSSCPSPTNGKLCKASSVGPSRLSF